MLALNLVSLFASVAVSSPAAEQLVTSCPKIYFECKPACDDGFYCAQVGTKGSKCPSATGVCKKLTGSK
jgi:hypothetical protein